MADTPIELKEATEVTITPELAKHLGYGSVAEFQEKLKGAADTKDNLEKLIPELAKSVEGFTAAVHGFTQIKRQEIEEIEFDAAMNDKFVQHYKSLPEGDKNREHIKRALLGEHRADFVELALEGDDLRKSLLRPLTQRNKNYEEISEFRNAWDHVITLTGMRKGGITEGENDDVADVNVKTLQKSIEQLDRLGVPGIEAVKATVQKALDSQTAGDGLEWLPVILSNDVVEQIMMELRVVPLFKRYPMPSKKFELPAYINRTRGFIIDEAIDDTAVGSATPFFSNFVTPSGVESRKIAFEARKYGTVVFLSDEIEEDAILPTIDIVRSEMQRGLAEGWEDATINGHYALSAGSLNGNFDNAGSTGNRLFSEAAGARDSRALWDGLRAMAYKSGITHVDGAPSSSWKAEGLDIYRNARKEMGKYGQVNLQDLFWLIGLSQHIELLKLNELVTIDKYGAQATVLSGEIAKLDGIPIVVSPFMYENLNNQGVYSNGEAVTYGAGQGWLTGRTSNTATDRTVSLCVNRRVAAFGDRRLVRFESERQPLAGQRYVLGTARMDFKKLYPAAEPMIGAVRNLAK
jgi:hypothetical protein